MDATVYRTPAGLPTLPAGARHPHDRQPSDGAKPGAAGRNIIGRSQAVEGVRTLIAQVAPTDSTVLLLGETGTGKERFAELIHQWSPRRTRQMIRVNCAAIPASLIESELFGHERGAYTDAIIRQIGRFEAADGSTIFLDEIGDLPADIQVKLLRVLEERTIERLGSPRHIRVDVRVIAATHRQLDARVCAGAFREDLFYRLNVFPIVVPPLRDRREDIEDLVRHFAAEFAGSLGKPIPPIPPATIDALRGYSWPGNIRELRNLVERAMVLSDGTRLVIPLPTTSPRGAVRSERLVDVQREHIRSILETTRWRIRGAGGAAERLGLRPTTLETRMARLGLLRPKPA